MSCDQNKSVTSGLQIKSLCYLVLASKQVWAVTVVRPRAEIVLQAGTMAFTGSSGQDEAPEA